MKILHLTLKKKWFDMIASGEKKEEYREMKDHWDSRLRNKDGSLKVFDYVRFSHAYSKGRSTMLVVWESCEIKCGKKEWGAELNKLYYTTSLGEIVELNRKIISK